MTDHATLYSRALKVTPGGVHSPVRAFRAVGGLPVFMERGHGPTLTDVCGRTFIDFCQSFGPLVLGHRDPDVQAAARDALDDGWTYGCCEPYSLALAEWIAARVPWAQQVRFVSSGTEAVMSALRIARAATARRRVLKFDGCYHGHVDALLVRAGSGLAGAAESSSDGVSPSVADETLVAPLPANYGLLPQRPEWLRRLAALCREHGSLLIFDEVISGFRLGVTGMAGRLGLHPDLVTYGKVIGGGFPVGAYAGPRRLMELVAPVGRVYQAGTLSANPVGMRAGLATLGKMEAMDGWRTLDDRTRDWCATLTAGFSARHLPLDVVHEGSIFWIRRRADGAVRTPQAIPAGSADWYARFFHAALNRGVYLAPSSYEVGFLSLAHDEQTLDRAADALVGAAHEAER